MLWDTEDLVLGSTLARKYSVTRQAINSWEKRKGFPGRMPNPNPEVVLFSAKAVHAWWLKNRHQAGRPRSTSKPLLDTSRKADVPS